MSEVVDFIEASDIPGENTFYVSPNSDPVSFFVIFFTKKFKKFLLRMYVVHA